MEEETSLGLRVRCFLFFAHPTGTRVLFWWDLPVTGSSNVTSARAQRGPAPRQGGMPRGGDSGL